MPYVAIDDMQLYYELDGPEGAPPLLLLHGGGGTIDDATSGWAGLQPAFAEHYRVIAAEHRGHGHTDNPAGFQTFDQMGDDIAALIEFVGLGPVHVAGISDGGVIALDLALRRPHLVRTITIVGANYCVDDLTRGAASSIDAEAIERDHPEAASAFAARHDHGKGDGYWKELIRHIVANNDVNPEWSVADLHRIGCPVLLIGGENDPFANIDQMTVMKREIPNAEWLIVNHAGHPVHFEHPEIIGPQMLDFLARNS